MGQKMRGKSVEDYQSRLIDRQLDLLLKELPAVLLDGPKAVGKTTTATQRANTLWAMDTPEARFVQDNDPLALTSGAKPILVDEWHRAPSVWDTIKRAVDADPTPGRFLLTGSLPSAGTHSGAGRITSLRMRPLSLQERGTPPPTVSLGALLEGRAEAITGNSSMTFADYCDEMGRSGFPGLRHLSAFAREQALEGYIERIIDSDLPEMGLRVKRPATMRAWLTSYAAATATTASWETIRDAANTGSTNAPSKVTVMPYRDALTRLRILDELPAWLPGGNDFSRVGQSPKHFLADPALALRLLGHDATQLGELSRTHTSGSHGPLLGRLFEALAVLSIRTYAQTNFATTSHFRDGNGRHEIDVIVQGRNGSVVALEIKLGMTVNDSDFRHLRWLKGHLGDRLTDMVVVYSGSLAFRKDGIAVVPLALLGA